MVYIIMLVRK